MSSVPSAGIGKITVPASCSANLEFLLRILHLQRLRALRRMIIPLRACLTKRGGCPARGRFAGDGLLGHESTLPVTLEEMLHHTRAVRRARITRCWWRICPSAAITRSGGSGAQRRSLCEGSRSGSCQVEGGERRMDIITRLVEAEIPVMGHIGLTPQSVNAFGDSVSRARPKKPANNCCATPARWKRRSVLHRAGVNPPRAGAKITAELRIPTIGIGAGPDCDGQVLVINDLRAWASATSQVRAALRKSGGDYFPRRG